MQTLNGRRVHQQEIRVNWAYQSNTVTKEDTSNHFHIFVGDLSNEVNDEVLLQAFSAFGTVSEARVMWDMKTGRSRGYGFVAFRDRGDAEKALSNMDGEWLGSRAIRCNWANQKGQPSYSQQQAMTQMGMTPTTPFGHHSFPTQDANSYEMVVQQTPAWQTTCYVGNLTPYTPRTISFLCSRTSAMSPRLASSPTVALLSSRWTPTRTPQTQSASSTATRLTAAR